MDNIKGDRYYLDKMINDLEFLVKITKDLTESSIGENEMRLDSIMFRLIQISENSVKLTDGFKELHKNIPWRSIKGLRNRIVHDYGEVDLGVVYNTVKIDIPALLEMLEE